MNDILRCDIDAQLTEIENDGEKKYRSRNSDCEIMTPDTGKSKTGAAVKNRKGLRVALKEEKYK